VVFFVAAQGGALTYQWQKNNVDIGGATTDTYAINPLATTDDGQYRCVVTGTCGTKNSNPGTLDVHENTSITTQPVAKQICTNASNSLSIAASGENLTYQWQKDGSNISASARLPV
jgi:hypothetical protein